MLSVAPEEREQFLARIEFMRAEIAYQQPEPEGLDEEEADPSLGDLLEDEEGDDEAFRNLLEGWGASEENFFVALWDDVVEGTLEEDSQYGIVQRIADAMKEALPITTTLDDDPQEDRGIFYELKAQWKDRVNDEENIRVLMDQRMLV